MAKHSVPTIGSDIPWWLVALVILGAVVVGLSLALLRLDLEQDWTPHVVVVTPTTYGPPPA